MANSEHIQWLLEGVGAWNERRKREHFKPDLRGAHIPGEFGEGGLDESAEPEIRRMVFRTEDAGVDLSGIDLSEAELQDAILTNVNLSNANLRGADLKGCDFDGAILNEADLDFADLRRCTFHSGRLQGAKMFGGNRVSGSHNSISLCHAEFSGQISGERFSPIVNFLVPTFVTQSSKARIYFVLSLGKRFFFQEEMLTKELRPALGLARQ